MTTGPGGRAVSVQEKRWPSYFTRSGVGRLRGVAYDRSANAAWVWILTPASAPGPEIGQQRVLLAGGRNVMPRTSPSERQEFDLQPGSRPVVQEAKFQ